MAPSQPAKPTLVAAALGAVYLIWGSTYYAMHVALQSFPPLLMAGTRFLTAGAALWLWLRWRGAPRLSGREWGASALTGTLLLVVGNGAVAMAQRYISSSLAAIIVSTVPLWAAVFAALWGERPDRGDAIGLLIGFAGVVALNAGGELTAAGPGALIALLSPVSWSLGSLWSRRLPLPRGSAAAAAQMLCAGALLCALALARGERLAGPPSREALFALAYLVVFGSLIAFSAYGFLLRHTRPAVFTSYAYVNPVVALVIGVGLGGEHIAGPTWAATAVILAGVVLITARVRRPSPV